MKRTKALVKKILCPPKRIMLIIALLSFTALAFIFALEKTKNIPAYISYCMSAYSFSVLMLNVAKKIRESIKNSKMMKRITSSKIGNRYLSDLAFRGSVSIFQGMTANFFYMLFRIAVGVCYASVWMISMAVYYLLLGTIRAYLIVSYKNRHVKNEYGCYRKTAWSLFLLNIPMGGMILLMTRTNAGYFYPGFIIYISAIYTFYALITSVRDLLRFRKVGSPILSAAKVLNLVSAMMSTLGLQTAMISRFSERGESYRREMNTITGGIVYGAVIVIAICMLLHSSKYREEAKRDEQK